jgi:outer membrane lipoprotein SlyB
MKIPHHFKTVLGLAAVLALGACADMNTQNSSSNAYPQSSSSNYAYPSYGVVQSIDLVRLNSSAPSPIGAGTIAGAIVGGIVGNQIGQGDGNTAATVLGAAGGAYAGHQLEKRNQTQTDAYKFTIRMNDGSYQTLTQTANADIRVGDRVLIENGVARRY